MIIETTNLSIKGEPSHGYGAAGTFLQRASAAWSSWFPLGCKCCGDFLKDKIIFELPCELFWKNVSCSGNLCVFSATVLNSQPTLKHVQIEMKDKNLLRFHITQDWSENVKFGSLKIIWVSLYGGNKQRGTFGARNLQIALNIEYYNHKN